MKSSTRATVCVFACDEPPQSLEPSLSSVLNHAPSPEIELRMGFVRAEVDFALTVGSLCPDGVTPQYYLLPGGIERFQWFGRDGLRVRAWRTVRDSCRPSRHSLEQMRRLVLHDVPLEAEYTVFLDGSPRGACATSPGEGDDCAPGADTTPLDGDLVHAGWWETLLPIMDRGVDYIGAPVWREYGPKDIERIQAKTWYLGVPFERRSGRAGVSFMRKGVIAVR
jgi:hypothetical protein